MASPPHRANILDPTERYLGVGVVQRGDSAWNTLDFTDAYSSAYGPTRVPADGITPDAWSPTSSLTLASLEYGFDQRFGSQHTGAGYTSLVRVTGPSSANDYAYAYFVGSRWSGAGCVYMRDPVNYAQARSLSFQLGQSNRNGRPLSVQVILNRNYVDSVSLGTLQVATAPRWYTLALPARARSLQDTLVLRVTNGALSALGTTRLDIYTIRANS
jgi:hypothetical protein